MSKAVMMSIQPKWCELIANGKKTIEVRKTKPNLETPFKVYIYCTKAKDKASVDGYTFFADELYIDHWSKTLTCGHTQFEEIVNGKVIGEFVCDRVTKFSYDEKYDHITLIRMGVNACLTKTEIEDYANGEYFIYGWHISDLVIYDKPKELSEFYRLGNPLICDGRNCENCNHLKYMQVNSDEWDYDCDCQHQLENRITLKRPPQSWCYVSK